MCYTIPAAAAIAATFAWARNKSQNTRQLMLMFYGAALFGVIDHLWSGELFLISNSWAKDLALGVVITAAIALACKAITVISRKNSALAAN